MTAPYIKWIVILSLLIFESLILYAQSETPFLRLETGMHNARSSSLSVDAKGHYLLSCSDDKTARLWDASTGKLVNTLRIPIGENDEGKLFACALSPDAKLAAVGGHTRSEKETECICIIDPFTGEIIRNLCNLPDIVNRLEFSPDSKWLAAGLGSGGVRIYNVQTWQVQNLAGEYRDEVYGLSFSSNGKFVTSCYDGFIRLYSLPDFSLIAHTNTLAGKFPYSVGFNPSGDLVAVGYSKQPVTEVLYTSNLQKAYMPDVSGLPVNEDISSVGFNNDGHTLYAGGSYEKADHFGNRKYLLRKWEDGGKSTYSDLMLLDNTIMAIKPLPAGKMTLIGAYPDISVIDQAGNIAWYKKADNLNFALNKPDDFKLSLEGNAVSVSTDYGEPLFFKIKDRSLYQDNAVYYPPVIQTARVNLTSFKNTTEPSINGFKVTFLAKDETCRSACLNSDGTRIAWGADYNLYVTDNSGRLIWKTSLPEVAFAVNIAAENKAVTVALGDGTIRWYNIATGKELLSLYIKADRQHWILYTPKGYYDASPGSEDILGWHVNNGLEKAPSFFPASSFKESYYRPDIIDAIADKWDENIHGNFANENNKSDTPQQLTKENVPPTIIINSPHSGTEINSDMVTVNYSLNAPQSAPVKNIKVLVDGRPVTTQRGVIVSANSSYDINVNIPKRSCTVTLLAENDYGTSPETNLYLKYNDPGQSQQKAEKKPTLYILAIGVSEYMNPAYKLNYAADDALSFAAAFNNQKGLLYGDVIVKCLTDENATKGNIEDNFEWLKQQTTGTDVAMIFFAGHGINDNAGVFYMAPAGADMKSLLRTCVDFSELIQTIDAIHGKVIVFIDACHSGDVTGGKSFGDINRVVNELSNPRNGAVVFTSSTGREFSLEDPAWKHGAFTRALLDGLNGGALFEKGQKEVTVKSLDFYIANNVKKITGGKQNPTSVSPPNVPDFTICVINK